MTIYVVELPKTTLIFVKIALQLKNGSKLIIVLSYTVLRDDSRLAVGRQ